MYIPLGKIPSSPEERQNLLALKDKMEEHLSSIEMTHVQQKIVDFLMCNKQYSSEEIETNVVFRVNLADTAFDVKADIILKIDGKRFMLLKCVMNSIESWERHSMAFGRVVESYQIPYALVTDGENARMLDVIKGMVIAEGLDSVPSAEKAREIICQSVFIPYQQERAEKEKRILYAFNSINCSTTICDT